MEVSNRLNLYEMETGKSGLVREVNADEVIRQRLFDMGLLPNNAVIKERCALGGDPVWIRLDGVQLALRRQEAEAVVVEVS